MAAHNDRRSSGKGRSAAPANPQQRRGFGKSGRTELDRAKDLPIDRQIRALLKNPTPSPAEQARLCELTRTKSFRAAVTVAKRMMAPPAPEAAPVEESAAPARSVSASTAAQRNRHKPANPAR